MSKAKNRTRNSRQQKRARFEEPARGQTNRTTWIVGGGVAILVVGLIVVGVLLSSNQQASRANPANNASANVPAANAASGGAANVQTRYTPVQVADDGAIRWPMNTFDDGQAHYYSFVDGNRSIDFFILKSSDGVVRAAFDACDVCFPARRGYRQQGDLMICNNCGQQFPSVKINEVRGGCNPAPLERAVDGTDLVIHGTDITAGAGYF